MSGPRRNSYVNFLVGEHEEPFKIPTAQVVAASPTLKVIVETLSTTTGWQKVEYMRNGKRVVSHRSGNTAATTVVGDVDVDVKLLGIDRTAFALIAHFMEKGEVEGLMISNGDSTTTTICACGKPGQWKLHEALVGTWSCNLPEHDPTPLLRAIVFASLHQMSDFVHKAAEAILASATSTVPEEEKPNTKRMRLEHAWTVGPFEFQDFAFIKRVFGQNLRDDNPDDINRKLIWQVASYTKFERSDFMRHEKERRHGAVLGCYEVIFENQRGIIDYEDSDDVDEDWSNIIHLQGISPGWTAPRHLDPHCFQDGRGWTFVPSM